MQEQLIRSLYESAGLTPESLEYIEAHGTGTKVRALPGPVHTPHPTPERRRGGALTSLSPPQVGDPQELNSITRALCATRQDPLLIGSTKSNMGHAEPASGLAALVKVGGRVWGQPAPASSASCCPVGGGSPQAVLWGGGR